MSRQINIADNKGRNAEVIFKSYAKKPLVKTITQKGEATHTVRVLKSVAENSYEHLLKLNGGDEAVAQALITADPEFDVSMTGLFVAETSKVYINSDLKPVFRIQKTEAVYLPDGSLKEERTPKETISNILAENPVKPAGKLLPKKEVYNKFVFSKKYQLTHINGLTFDFLYEMAKELQEKEAQFELTLQQKLQAERELLSEQIKKQELEKNSIKEKDHQLQMMELKKRDMLRSKKL